MPSQHTEQAFEAAIEAHLLATAGYSQANNAAFDLTRTIDTNQLLAFVRETQKDTWDYLVNLQKDRAEATLLDDLCRALDSEHEGCLKVLRHGFKCFGKLFRVAYFAPASSMNPETERLYGLNRLTVTRQLRYSPNHGNTIDLVLSLNGIPVVTAELKNPMSGQNWRHAVHQYKNDRDPKDKIFQFRKRALVHFAVDPDEVYMTTRLSGQNTRFLPFNKGNGTAAGNPDNPGGYKTAYLWQEVLQRDSILDILARFMHLHVEEKLVDGRKLRKHTMIFPRYHQLDCVRKLVSHARDTGVGSNYLIQHSAGSGKSNSIAWLAHRLSSLHGGDDEKVFDSVIVITDRLVLDQQLQNTIYQFEHKQGVVRKIDENSAQLANSLASAVPIVITTLQKFPFVTEKIGDLPARKYAVIIDEAHSSQSGEGAAEMRGVLAGAKQTPTTPEPDNADSSPDYEEQILKTLSRRGRQPNISFFAFTATPKYRTLEMFGVEGPDGKPQAFHLYSMRQAIQEKFILDVLAHYITYKSYFQLVKQIKDDPDVHKRKAASALARFLSLHPVNIAQKTEVMVEHFRTFVRHKMGGKAKAMVVTGSRLHAVRYKQAFDKYIHEKGYRGIRTLVAFSGTVVDHEAGGKEYTEVGMNDGIREKELPEKFSTDEYQVLLVAEKYQTGFDQPLLHTMYVDRRLAGIQAVQTLSRLNRTRAGKEDTFVLDFVNDREEILEAFKPYYEQTEVGERVEASHLYELQARLDGAQVYYSEEVEAFAEVFFKQKAHQTPTDHARMNAAIDTAVTRFVALEEQEGEVFRKTLIGFKNLYSFLSQIIPFQDADLEKLYAYVRFLLSKLPPRDSGPTYIFDDEVSLRYYRLQKIAEGALKLHNDRHTPISGPTDVGTAVAREDRIELSRLIDQLNERFGTQFTPSDQLFFDSIREDARTNPRLQQAAKANTLENFRYLFVKTLEDIFIERMEQNEDITARFMNSGEFKAFVGERMAEAVYNDIRVAATG